MPDTATENDRTRIRKFGWEPDFRNTEFLNGEFTTNFSLSSKKIKFLYLGKLWKLAFFYRFFFSFPPFFFLFSPFSHIFYFSLLENIYPLITGQRRWTQRRAPAPGKRSTRPRRGPVSRANTDTNSNRIFKMPDSTFILIYRRINEYDIWWNTGRKMIDISAGLYIMQNTGCWGGK